MIPAAVFVLVFVPMLVEDAISRRNERSLRSLGAREPENDVYAAMQFGYPAAFLSMILEGWWQQPQFGVRFGTGLAIFAAGKMLKYWAIAVLGSRWTFRVLVPPGSGRVTSGLYRALNHPNYIGVAGELVGAALMLRAVLTGPPATLCFLLLIRRRIAIEERALRCEG